MDPSGAATNASLLSDNDLKSDQTSHPVSVKYDALCCILALPVLSVDCDNSSTTRSKISIAISGLAPRPLTAGQAPGLQFPHEASGAGGKPRISS